MGGEAGSELAGKLTANILATMGGGLVGGSAGAATASNVNLYNQWHDKSGAYADEQIAQAMGESGRKPASPYELILKSAANGLNAIVGMGGGKPPAASPGAVLVDSAVGQAAGAGISSGSSVAGYAPGNATLNNGNNDQSLGGKSVSDLSDAAKVPDSSDRSGELTGAGRALQKHGGRDGSAFPAAKGNPDAINEQGQKIVDGILNDPSSTVTQRNTGRFGDVIDITASDAAWSSL